MTYLDTRNPHEMSCEMLVFQWNGLLAAVNKYPSRNAKYKTALQ